MLSAFGESLSHASVRRDVQEAGEDARWSFAERAPVRALLCHRRRGDVPWTNNMTERAIGRSKIRYKTVRGYKSESGLLNGFWLTQWAWSGADGLELSELVAA